VSTDSFSVNLTRMEKWFTSRPPPIRFGISIRCFWRPAKTTAVAPRESVFVVGLQLVSDPTGPFFPAPPFPFPDASGTVEPEMFAKLRLMTGRGPVTPTVLDRRPDALAGATSTMQAAATAMTRLTRSLPGSWTFLVTIVALSCCH